MIKDIPKIGIGTWLVEDQKTIDLVIKTALEANYHHIDTAQIYNNEYQIGNALKKYHADRENLFITSKIWIPNFKYHLLTSLKESLNRLQLKKIDLILLHHAVNDKEIILKAYKELIKARKQGLVNHIGVSNFLIEDLEFIHQKTGEYPYANQIIATPLIHTNQLDDFCKKNNIHLIAYSTLKPYYQNQLGIQKYTEKHQILTNNEKQIIDEIAKKNNSVPANVLLKWIINHGYCIIPKSVTPSRIKNNIHVNDLQLSNDEMLQIDNISKIDYQEFTKIIHRWRTSKLEASEENYQKGFLFDKNF